MGASVGSENIVRKIRGFESIDLIQKEKFELDPQPTAKSNVSPTFIARKLFE